LAARLLALAGLIVRANRPFISARFDPRFDLIQLDLFG